MTRLDLKQQALQLRMQGQTYSDIQAQLGFPVSKSTLSHWCSEIELPSEAIEKLRSESNLRLERARQKSIKLKKERHELYLAALFQKNKSLACAMEDRSVAKIALAMLYLGEGGKKNSSVSLGNSDPNVIKLFMRLFRRCYSLDEKKFRCTVQCRVDQDTEKLKYFWQEITDIPVSQFYGPCIDKRTAGKPTGAEYKGVCRIDYLSADIFYEIMQTIKVIFLGP